jgi:flagellar biosynthesis protein FlhB
MTKHPPTAQQQQRARRRGDVAYSGALQAAVGVWVVGVWVLWMGEGWIARWREGMQAALRGDGGSGQESATQAWMVWAQWLTWQAGWLLLGLLVAGGVVGALQVGGVVKGQRGGRAGGGEGAAQGMYRLLGWAGLMAYGVWRWSSVLERVLGQGVAEIGGEVGSGRLGWSMAELWEVGADSVSATLAAAAVFAVGDRVLTQWLRWRRLHMTPSQARADAAEGSPNQAIRQRLRQAAQPQADEGSAALEGARRVIVTDWGGVVVAISDLCRGQCVCLSYRPPLVDPPHLAKIAQTQEEAQELLAALSRRGIMVVEEPPLLRQLLYGCQLGDPIPRALFERVGALLGSIGLAAQGSKRGSEATAELPALKPHDSAE